MSGEPGERLTGGAADGGQRKRPLDPMNRGGFLGGFEIRYRLGKRALYDQEQVRGMLTQAVRRAAVYARRQAAVALAAIGEGEAGAAVLEAEVGDLLEGFDLCDAETVREAR